MLNLLLQKIDLLTDDIQVILPDRSVHKVKTEKNQKIAFIVDAYNYCFTKDILSLLEELFLHKCIKFYERYKKNNPEESIMTEMRIKIRNKIFVLKEDYFSINDS